MYPDERNGKPQNLKNLHVRFHICDAYVPSPSQILSELHGQDMLQGRIICLCDHGIERDTYALVEVESIGQQVVVPVAKILRLEESSGHALDSSTLTDT